MSAMSGRTSSSAAAPPPSAAAAAAAAAAPSSSGAAKRSKSSRKSKGQSQGKGKERHARSHAATAAAVLQDASNTAPNAAAPAPTPGSEATTPTAAAAAADPGLGSASGSPTPRRARTHSAPTPAPPSLCAPSAPPMVASVSAAPHHYPHQHLGPQHHHHLAPLHHAPPPAAAAAVAQVVRERERVRVRAISERSGIGASGPACVGPLDDDATIGTTTSSSASSLSSRSATRHSRSAASIGRAAAAAVAEYERERERAAAAAAASSSSSFEAAASESMSSAAGASLSRSHSSLSRSRSTSQAGSPVVAPLSFFALAPAQPLSIDTCQPLLLPAVSLLAPGAGAGQTTVSPPHSPAAEAMELDAELGDRPAVADDDGDGNSSIQPPSAAASHGKMPRSLRALFTRGAAGTEGTSSGASSQVTLTDAHSRAPRSRSGTQSRGTQFKTEHRAEQDDDADDESDLDFGGAATPRYGAGNHAWAGSWSGSGFHTSAAMSASSSSLGLRLGAPAGSSPSFSLAAATAHDGTAHSHANARLLAATLARLAESDGSCHGDPGDDDPETQLATAILRMKSSSANAGAVAARNSAAAVVARSMHPQQADHPTNVTAAAASAASRARSRSRSRRRSSSRPRRVARAETFEQQEARLARAIHGSTLPALNYLGRALFFFDGLFRTAPSPAPAPLAIPGIAAADDAHTATSSAFPARADTAPAKRALSATAHSPIRRRQDMRRVPRSASTPDDLLSEAQALRRRSLARRQSRSRSQSRDELDHGTDQQQQQQRPLGAARRRSVSLSAADADDAAECAATPRAYRSTRRRSLSAGISKLLGMTALPTPWAQDDTDVPSSSTADATAGAAGLPAATHSAPASRISSWLSLPSLLSRAPSITSFSDADDEEDEQDDAYAYNEPAQDDTPVAAYTQEPASKKVLDLSIRASGLPIAAPAVDESDELYQWPASASPTYSMTKDVDDSDLMLLAPRSADGSLGIDVLDLFAHRARAGSFGDMSPSPGAFGSHSPLPLPYYAFAAVSPTSPFARLPVGAHRRIPRAGAGAGFGGSSSPRYANGNGTATPTALEDIAAKGLDGASYGWEHGAAAAARQSSRLAGKAIRKYIASSGARSPAVPAAGAVVDAQ